MIRNTGAMPREAAGKRVRGVLRNGQRFGGSKGWSADGKGACRWTLTGDPFDILQWEIAS